MQKNFSHQSGFSLLELIVATTIIAVISMISTSAYTGYIEATKISQSISQVRTLSFLIDNYALDNDMYPESLSDIGNENLKDPWGNPYTYVNLKSNNNNNQNDSEHDSEHHDGGGHDGGNDTNISAARKDGNLVPINTNYDLCSSGKDGKSKAPLRAKDSHDDIIYANDGGYIGLASEF